MKLLLKPEHFADAEIVQFVDGGLRVDGRVGVEIDRDIVLMGEDDKHSRRKTRVVANPTSITAQELRRLMNEADDNDPDKEAARGGYGLDELESYKTNWGMVDAESEGQELVLVAFDAKDKPAGYAVVRIALFPEFDDKLSMSSLDLMVSPEMFYAVPKLRGKGYGLDLTAAVAMTLRDVLVATYKAVPEGVTINISVFADFITEGGEDICNRLVDWLTYNADTIPEDLGRAGVEISNDVYYDAGY